MAVEYRSVDFITVMVGHPLKPASCVLPEDAGDYEVLFFKVRRTVIRVYDAKESFCVCGNSRIEPGIRIPAADSKMLRLSTLTYEQKGAGTAKRFRSIPRNTVPS